MGYYTAIKRKKVLIHATMWMNSENMLMRRCFATSQRVLTFFAGIEIRRIYSMRLPNKCCCTCLFPSFFVMTSYSESTGPKRDPSGWYSQLFHSNDEKLEAHVSWFSTGPLFMTPEFIIHVNGHSLYLHNIGLSKKFFQIFHILQKNPNELLSSPYYCLCSGFHIYLLTWM